MVFGKKKEKLREDIAIGREAERSVRLTLGAGKRVRAGAIERESVAPAAGRLPCRARLSRQVTGLARPRTLWHCHSG